MRVVGTIEQPEDPNSGKLKKGLSFPDNESAIKDGDLFALMGGAGDETLYIRSNGSWLRVVTDGDTLDAGVY